MVFRGRVRPRAGQGAGWQEPQDVQRLVSNAGSTETRQDVARMKSKFKRTKRLPG